MENEKYYKERAQKVMSGKISEVYSQFIRNTDDSFLYAFIKLLCLIDCKVHYIDEVKLTECEDKLDYLSETQNVNISVVTLPDDWYKNDYGCFIGFYGEDEKPVVLKKTMLGYLMIDPENDKKIKINANNIQNISDIAISVQPLADKEDKNGYKFFFKTFFRQKKELFKFFIFTVMVSIITAIIPVCVSFITNYFIPRGDGNSIAIVGISMGLCIVSCLIVNIVVSRIKARMQTRVRSQMFCGLSERMLMLPSNVEHKISGKLISLAMPFLNAVDSLVGSGLSTVLYFVQCIIILVQLGMSAGSIGPFFWSIIIIDIIIAVIIQFLMYKRMGTEKQKRNKLSTVQRELFDNIEAIKNNSIENRSFYWFTLAYNEHINTNLKLENLSQWSSIICTVLSGIGIFGIFIFTTLDTTIAVSAVSGIISSFTLLTGYLSNLINSSADVVKNISYMEFADMILDKPIEKIKNDGLQRDITGKIQLSHVNFSYGDSENTVIKDLNLSIASGEYIGIVGTSGCGKSTLIKLLLGFEKPNSGAIFYDDTDFELYNKSCIRKQFGVVLQNADIITGSILSNIGQSDDADIDRVRDAAKQAAILDEIEAMPMKFNTILSSEADTVSGGQKQRIVLARSLFNEPKILFLDEATSAMDNISQAIVKENMDKLGITRIVVAHRLSTIKDCDRILVMDNGQIVEDGTFDELMDNNGLFAHMAKRNLTN